MRKTLILLLALIMLLSLFACRGGDDTTDSDDVSKEPTDTSTDQNPPIDTSDPTDTSAPADTSAPDDTSDTTTDPTGTDEPEFISVNETVYVYGTDVLNVRKEPSKNSELVGEMKSGEQVTRIGYNDTWSKISYYGEVCYASSEYLTTTAPLSFKDQTDKVYIVADGRLYLRDNPSLKADVVAYLPYGTELSRTGVANGVDEDGITWSRVLYNGKVCYASTKYLAEELPADDFKIVYENVYVVSSKDNKPVTELNLRYTPSLSGNIFKTVKAETQLLRIGVANSADDDDIIWSKLLYTDGTVCYASSSYLTTAVPNSLPDVDIPAGYTLFMNDDIAFAYPMEWEESDEASVLLFVDTTTGNNITVAYQAKTDHTSFTRSTFMTELKPTFEASGLTISNVTLSQKENDSTKVTIYDYDVKTSDGIALKQSLMFASTLSRTYIITVTQASAVPELADNVYNSITVLK